MVARLSTTMAAAAAFSLSSRRLLASCSFLGFAQENTRMSFRAFHNGEAAATPLSGSNGFPFLFPSLRHLSSSTASSSSSYKQKGEGGRRGGGGGAKHFSWEKLRKEYWVKGEVEVASQRYPSGHSLKSSSNSQPHTPIRITASAMPPA